MGTGDNESGSEDNSEYDSENCESSTSDSNVYFISEASKAFVAANEANNNSHDDDRIIIDSGAAVTMFRDRSHFVKCYNDREVHIRGVSDGQCKGVIGVLQPNNLGLRMAVWYEELKPAALISSQQLTKLAGWDVLLSDEDSRMEKGGTIIPIDNSGELPIVSRRFR